MKHEECVLCGSLVPADQLKVVRTDAQMNRSAHGPWCAVCYKTSCGQVQAYTSGTTESYIRAEVGKMLAQCTNMVLSEIARAREMEGNADG